MLHANNKGGDQTVHLHSLISTFVICSLESIKSYHIFGMLFSAITQFAYAISSFPPTGYHPAMTDNRKSGILNGERLSCPA